MRSLLLIIIRGAISAFLGLFGISPERKLGRDETALETQKNVIKDISDAKAIETANADASDPALDAKLLKFTRRS